MPSTTIPTSHSGILGYPYSSVFCAAIVITIIAVCSLSFSTLLGPWAEILVNPGLYIDLLALLFLVFMLWCTTRPGISQFTVQHVRYGLLLWIAGGACDLMDEVVVQPRWVGYYFEDVFRLSGMLLTAIGIYKIISKINLLYVDARTRSLHDELTQLPNRRFFIDTIREKQSKPGLLALMILDIDHFKKINDTWGHMVGDEVLFSLGKMLSGMSSKQVHAARIGGEEFAIIVDGYTSVQVGELAQKILEDARNILIDNSQPLSVSIGVGMHDRGQNQELLIKKVDDALYRAKNNGRGRIEWAP